MIGFTSEISDDVSFGQQDHHLYLYPQMKQVWWKALLKDTSWIQTHIFRLQVWRSRKMTNFSREKTVNCVTLVWIWTRELSSSGCQRVSVSLAMCVQQSQGTLIDIPTEQFYRSTSAQANNGLIRSINFYSANSQYPLWSEAQWCDSRIGILQQIDKAVL